MSYTLSHPEQLTTGLPICAPERPVYTLHVAKSCSFKTTLSTWQDRPRKKNEVEIEKVIGRERERERERERKRAKERGKG